MAGEVPNTNDFMTFEVTLPRSSIEGIAALRGIALALDWRVRQRDALATDLDDHSLPELWRINDEQFLATSTELWGSADYGVTAASYFHRKKYADGYLWSNGEVNMNIPEDLRDKAIDGVPVIPLWIDGERNKTKGMYDLSDEALRKRARLLWDHRHEPFEPAITIEDSSARWPRTAHIFAGDMTRERLADYVRANGYDKHYLHGTIGKMFDTINVTAGIVAKEAIGDRDIDSEFIERQELEQMMDTAGLNTRQKNNILQRLDRAIRGQMETGRSYEHGEIVIEGRYDIWDFDRIATRSLTAIARSYTSRRETPTLRFLRQFS
jgi:hypothetical protein